jgi:hypothetical protein
LISFGHPKNSAIRFVDPQTRQERALNDDREPEEATNKVFPLMDDRLAADSSWEDEGSSVDVSVRLSADSSTVEPREESQEAVGAARSKRMSGMGLKRMLSRVRAIQAARRAVIVRLDDEESRRDPAKVDRWLEINRNKSKFLRDMWAKATLNRRLNVSARKYQSEINETKGRVLEERYSLEEGHGRRSTSLDDEENDFEIGSSSQDTMERPSSRYEASFYEELRAVLALEYQRATGRHDGVAILPDEVSCEFGDGSTVDSYSTMDDATQIPPQTLLEFVEQKIEDEILNSNTCINMEICEEFQNAINDRYGDGYYANHDQIPKRLLSQQNEFVF